MARKKKETIEVVKDYGEWNNIPESWEDITLKTMQEINKRTKEKGENFDMFDCMDIICHKSKEEVDNLPVPFFEEICNRLIFLKTSLPEVEAKPYCEIDGQRYQVNIVEELTVGEYTAVDTVLHTDDDNLATILAILCRKEGEKFDKKYENDVFEERIKMFENASILTVLPVITFFLQCFQISEAITHLSSEVEQGIDHIISDIQSSQKNGDSKGLSWRKRKKILRELKKLKNQIS